MTRVETEVSAFSGFQLIFALVISTVYGLIMMAVLVGILIQIQEDGPLAPSTLFLFIVAGEIIVAGLMHPQEVYCLPSGCIYYITIPSMYLLLIIYSVCNLNIVSWGTREVAEKKTKKVRIVNPKVQILCGHFIKPGSVELNKAKFILLIFAFCNYLES